LGVGTKQEIEEERRLLVAMTRAKDQLHVMIPQKFYTHGQRAMGGRHVYAQRTRFIPTDVAKHFRSRSWPQAQARLDASRATRVPVDVKAKMQTMWE
jgi:DNA helicase II / ATP-dependent DNA helicase PcrA